MKACPHCQSTYEDWIEFCFNDGVPLVMQEPKAAPPPRASARSAPPPPPTSVLDAPDVRMAMGADLPEPAFLGRFATPAAVAPPAAPVAAPAPVAEVSTPRIPLLPGGREVSAVDAFTAPFFKSAPGTPLFPGLDDEEPPAPPVAEPAPVAAEPAPVVNGSAAHAPDDEDMEATLTNGEPPPAPPTVVPAPAEPVIAAAIPAPSEGAPAPASGLDPDALSEIASAFQAPPSAIGNAATAPRHIALPESEDGRATMPLGSPYTEPAEEPAGRPARSVLDDDDTPRRAAGIGVALAGMLALGAFAVVAVAGGWWMMHDRGAAPVAVKEQAAHPLPAPVIPPPPAPVVTPEPTATTAPAPTTTPAPAPAPGPAVTPPPAVASATHATSPAPTHTQPATNTGSSASTVASNTSGTTAGTPARVPVSTPPTQSTPTTDAGAAGTTSDSVWGTPSAPTSGFLRILTDPDGATVYVNEVAKGKTPLTAELPYGVHHVRVVRAGYKTEVRDVNIRVRELTVPFNLKPEVVTGQVNVYGPDGYRVVVDGHDMGPMPVTVQVSEGVRQFKLIGGDGTTCTLPKEIKFKAAGRPETVTIACP
jgi:hypothetical protein